MHRSLLIVAGLDPSGGAGLVADAATARARGLHPAAVATALTTQDSSRCLESHPVDAALVGRQIARLVDDLEVVAVKIGMLATVEVARAVAEALAPLVARGVPVVLDPVLRASVGADLLEGDTAAALAPWASMASLLTPNREEAERLTGLSISDEAGQLAAARALRGRGFAAVLLKGGHLAGDTVSDLLVDGERELWMRSPRRPGATPRGTGCALATEIACLLGDGVSLAQAVPEGHARLARRIAAAEPGGRGRPFLGPATSSKTD